MRKKSGLERTHESVQTCSYHSGLNLIRVSGIKWILDSMRFFCCQVYNNQAFLSGKIVNSDMFKISDNLHSSFSNYTNFKCT